MKIGIIADIHAEYDALKIALDQLEGQGVDQILCAGDLVGKGKQPEKVVSLIRSRAIPCVMGNHDAGEPSYQRELWKMFQSKPPADMLLLEDSIAYLTALPLTQCFEWAGKTILLAHGTPSHNILYVFPHSSQKLLDMVVEQAQADIIILGHTHEPMQIEYKNSLILNPGSICGKESHGSSSYGILTLPEGSFKIHRI